MVLHRARKRRLWWLLGMWAVGLALRLVVCAQFAASPFGPLPWVDEASYHSWAQRIRAGHLLLDHPFFQDPLYPHVLAGWMALVGEDPVLLRWISAVVGSLLVPLVYLAGRRAVGPTAALVAAGLAAVYVPAIQFSVLLLKPTLVTLVVAALLWSAGRFSERRHWTDALGIGLLCGLGCLLRGNFLLAVPVVAVWVGWRSRGVGSWRSRGVEASRSQGEDSAAVAGRGIRVSTVASVACFAAGVMGCLSLSLAHNWLAARQWVLTTSQAGMVFYLGNNPEATGGFSNPSWATAVPGIEHEQFVAEARRRANNPAMTEAESSRYWFAQARNWILQHPGDWLALCGNKLLVLVSRAEHSDNHYYEFLAERFYPWTRRLPFRWDVLLVLGAIGLTYPFCDRALKTFVLATAAAFIASMLIFYVLARYRMVLVPLLFVSAGVGVTGMIGQVRRCELWAIAWRIGLVGLPLAVLSWSFQLRPALPHQLLTLGQAYSAAGEFDKADAYLRAAIFLSPTEVGGYYFGREKYTARDALTAEPVAKPAVSAPASDWLRWARWQRRMQYTFTSATLAELGAVTRREPHADLLYELAVLRSFHQGRRRSASTDQKTDPLLGRPPPIALRDPRVARPLLEEALSLDPRHVPSLVALGCLALHDGDRDAARRYWTRALDHADEPFLVRKLLELL